MEVARAIGEAIERTARQTVHSISIPGVFAAGEGSTLYLAPDTGTLVAFDGRLYARVDLRSALHLPHETPDAALVLGAFRRWGADFPSRIIGDFAVALWDPARRTLIGARDPLGIRPLCYTVDASRAVICSLPSFALAAPGTELTPNLPLVGELLAQRLTSHDETLYLGISRVPPGHAVSINPTAHRVRAHWDLGSKPTIRYASEGDYAEHFRDLFETAVAERIADTVTPGVTLSGGLDSSAVAGMAQSLLVAEGAGRKLRPYSTRYPGLTCDEGPFIDAVCDRWGLTSNPNPFDSFAGFSWRTQARELRDLPEYPFATRTRPLYSQALRDGVKVLLTGEGGDFWHDGSTLPHRQMIMGGRLWSLIRELRHEAGYTGWLHALKLAAASLLWPLTPTTWRTGWEARRQSHASLGLLHPEFARSIGLEERIRAAAQAGRYPDAAEWQLQSRATGAVLTHFYEMMERTASLAGIELRHPLLDQRLLEFVSRVPDYIRRAGPEDRAIIRRGVADLLPRLVRERRSAPVFGVVLERAIREPEVLDLLRDPRIRERPWIEASAYVRSLAEVKQPTSPGAHPKTRSLYALWMVFAVEAWYRGAFE